MSEIRLGPGLSLFPYTAPFIQATAFTAEGDEIHDPECEWGWPSDVPDWNVNVGRNTISLTSEEDVASFEVTCSIGEVSASTSL